MYLIEKNMKKENVIEINNAFKVIFKTIEEQTKKNLKKYFFNRKAIP